MLTQMAGRPPKHDERTSLHCVLRRGPERRGRHRGSSFVNAPAGGGYRLLMRRRMESAPRPAAPVDRRSMAVGGRVPSLAPQISAWS